MKQGIKYFNRRASKKIEKKIEKDDEKMAITIAKSADFSELTLGYDHTYKQLDYLGMYVGEETTLKLEMSQPRKCSYERQKYDRMSRKHQTFKLVLEGPPPRRPENVYNKKTKKYDLVPVPISIPPIQYRGITLRQLRAVVANIRRRCVLEGWKNFEGKLISAEEVTMHDADKYVLRPFTVLKKESFVTSLPSTQGYQRPKWVVSHWWGGTIIEFVQCIEQFVRDFRTNHYDDEDKRGGGMTDDTPIWIWAFANNSWTQKEDILENNLENPMMSGLSKAMKVADGRTMTILDKNGAIFRRIWCLYEMSLTLIDRYQNQSKLPVEERLSAIYTAHKHTYIEPDSAAEEDRDAIGIISGGATSDAGYIPSITAREKSFPFDILTKSLSISVEEAEATTDSDRVHILNAITGNCGSKINNTPPVSHEQYNAVNDVLRKRFTSRIE